MIHLIRRRQEIWTKAYPLLARNTHVLRKRFFIIFTSIRNGMHSLPRSTKQIKWNETQNGRIFLWAELRKISIDLKQVIGGRQTIHGLEHDDINCVPLCQQFYALVFFSLLTFGELLVNVFLWILFLLESMSW